MNLLFLFAATAVATWDVNCRPEGNYYLGPCMETCNRNSAQDVQTCAYVLCSDCYADY